MPALVRSWPVRRGRLCLYATSLHHPHHCVPARIAVLRSQPVTSAALSLVFPPRLRVPVQRSVLRSSAVDPTVCDHAMNRDGNQSRRRALLLTVLPTVPVLQSVAPVPALVLLHAVPA